MLKSNVKVKGRVPCVSLKVRFIILIPVGCCKHLIS